MTTEGRGKLCVLWSRVSPIVDRSINSSFLVAQTKGDWKERLYRACSNSFFFRPLCRIRVAYKSSKEKIILPLFFQKAISNLKIGHQLIWLKMRIYCL